MKKAVIFLVALIMVDKGLMIAPVGIAEAIGSDNILEHNIRRGRTDELGGGSYLLVHLNDSMTFGIVHGDETTKAPITIFTKGSDTVAFIEQKNGTVPLRSTTFSVYRLGTLFEINDTNKNGRLDLQTVGASPLRRDSIVKRVNLSLNWEITPVQKKRIQEGYQWTFSLLARNVTYDRLPEPILREEQTRADLDDKTEKLSEESSDETGTLSTESTNNTVKPSTDTSDNSEVLSEDTSNDTEKPSVDTSDNSGVLSEDTSNDTEKPSTDNNDTLSVDTSNDPKEPATETVDNTGSLSADTSNNTDKPSTDTSDTVRQISRKEVLELIRFDFRVQLTIEGRTDIIYTYSAGELASRDALKEEDREKVDIEGVKVDWKMDHRILGWDFDPSNSDPKLILGFTLNYGIVYENIASFPIQDLLSKRGEISRVTIPVKGAVSSIWNEMENQLSPIEDDELDVGSISVGASHINSNMYWKSGLTRMPATSEGKQETSLFIYDLDLIGPDSDIWNNPLLGPGRGVGVSINGGYTYPPLQLIVHDPGLQSTGSRVPVKQSPKDETLDSIVINYIQEHTVTTVLVTLLVIVASIGVAAILTLSKRNGLVHDQELKWEKEEELFTVSRPKKNWDSLKVK